MIGKLVAGLGTAVGLVAAVAASSGAGATERIEITPALVAAAEKEGVVNLQYASPLLAMQGFIAEFNKAYPKIKVNMDRKSGAASAYALLQEMKAGVNRIDLYQGADPVGMRQLIEEKTFVAVEPANAGELVPYARALAPYLYMHDVNGIVVGYNSSLVSEAEGARLKSWQAILDPAFKGRIGILDPALITAVFPLTYILTTPGLGEDFLRKLKAQEPRIYTDTSLAVEALISGRSEILFAATYDGWMFKSIEKGAPVRFVYPEPTMTIGDYWGVMAKAPNPNAARLLLAWTLSRTGAKLVMEPYWAGAPTIAGMEDTREIVRKLKSEPWFKPLPEDSPSLVDAVVANTDRVRKTFDQIFRGR